MANKNNNQNGQQRYNGVTANGQNGESPDLVAARLTLIGAALSTIGDGLQAIGAAIALQELENPSNQNQQDPPDYSKQIARLQKQVDQLTKQMAKR